MSRSTFECPHCGAPVATGRLACPECGSDAGTGWQSSEEIDYQSVELPEDHEPAPARLRIMVPIVCALLVFAFLIWILL